MTARGRPLCRLEDIVDPGGKGFTLEPSAEHRDLFVVRRGGDAYAYVNCCPHVGTPLDWRPDQFLSADKKLLQCATHGALFEIATGLCVAGPCKGSRLTPVPIAVRDGAVVLLDVPSVAAIERNQGP